MPHDTMVVQAELEGVTKTASWVDGGAYSKPKPSLKSVGSWAEWRLEEIARVADIAAHELQTEE